MLYTLKTPKRTIADTPSGPVESYWNAAFNPIVFKVQRQDVKITSVANDGTGAAIFTYDPATVADNSLPGLLAVGQTVYINAGSYIGFYTISYVAYAQFTVSGTVFTATASGYANFITATKHYRIEAQIGTYENGTFTVIAETAYTPDAYGFAMINPMRQLQAALSADDDFPYNAVNKLDKKLSRPYRVALRETWTGVFKETTYIQTDPYYVTNSAKQVRDLYGQNMGAYVPFMPQPLNDNTSFDDMPLGDGWQVVEIQTAIDTTFSPGSFTVISGASGQNASLLAQFTPEVGKSYTLSYSVTINGNIRVRAADVTTQGAWRTATGVYSDTIVSDGTLLRLEFQSFQAGLTGVKAAVDWFIIVSTETASETPAKFLTEFATPTYWHGFPFDLAFIYSELIAGNALNKVEHVKDYNGTELALEEYELDTSQSKYINRMTLFGNYVTGYDPADALTGVPARVCVWLEAVTVICDDCYWNEGYAAEGYVECECDTTVDPGPVLTPTGNPPPTKQPPLPGGG